MYDDAVPPTHGSLKGRLGELEQELGLNDPDISKNFMAMRNRLIARRMITTEGTAALRQVVETTHRSQHFTRNVI